uniref:Ribosomal protein L32 n=1 Tax=Romanomermis culicivorax TaxID=13658 RepID=A0A915JM05_ROMCU
MAIKILWTQSSLQILKKSTGRKNSVFISRDISSKFCRADNLESKILKTRKFSSNRHYRDNKNRIWFLKA